MDLFGTMDPDQVQETFAELSSEGDEELGANAANAATFFANWQEQQHESPPKRSNSSESKSAKKKAAEPEDEDPAEEQEDMNGNTSGVHRGRGPGGKGSMKQMWRVYENPGGIRILPSPGVDPEEAEKFIPDTSDEKRIFSSFATDPHTAGADRQSIWSVNPEHYLNLPQSDQAPDASFLMQQ